MRKFTSKLAASYFDENDIGCQEKKSLGKPLNEDDLEQIAKEKYVLGLIICFGKIENKVLRNEFWASLEPKLNFISRKGTWLKVPNSDDFKIKISFNKNYYENICKYYLNAEVNDEYIIFKDSDVKQIKEFKEKEVKSSFISFKISEAPYGEGPGKNPFFAVRICIFNNQTRISHLDEFIEYLQDYEIRLKSFVPSTIKYYPLLTNEFYTAKHIWNFYREFYDSFDMINQLSCLMQDNYILNTYLAAEDELKIRENKIKQLKEMILQTADNKIIDIKRELKKTNKTITDLSIYSKDGRWYGTRVQHNTFLEALDYKKLIEDSLSSFNSLVTTLNSFKLGR